MKPTIVLVHGAFAESASWNAVIDILHANDQPVIAASNPLRGLASDAETVSDLVRSIDGPVVLAGHSYGGAVITNVDPDAGDIVGLAYVAAFAPAAGEDCISLSQQYPGSTLGEALRPVPRHDGTTDLYIVADKFHGQFCADVPSTEAARMAATQRPVTQEALSEPTNDTPLWRSVPSWFVFGEDDRNIPAALIRFMAQRADARRQIAIPGASHAISVSQPREVAALLAEAATTSAAAA